MTTSLVLELAPTLSPDGVLDDDSVGITLRNQGPSPVVVTGRLAIGYESGTDREVYLVITRRGTGEVVGTPAQLYHRAPVRDVTTLEPGQSVTTQLRLRDWYDCPGGELDVVAVYDPTEAARTLPEIADGLVTSPRVPVVVGRRG